MENVTLGEIAKILTLVTGIMTSLGIISNYFVKKLKLKFNDEFKESISPFYKAMQCSLRNDILTIYTMRKEEKKLSVIENQAINYSFEAYKAIGGNSFVENLVNEINSWEVIN